MEDLSNKEFTISYNYDERIASVLAQDEMYKQFSDECEALLISIRKTDKTLSEKIDNTHNICEARVQEICYRQGFQDGMNMILTALQGKCAIKDLSKEGR